MLKIQSTTHDDGIHLLLTGYINGRSYNELAVSLNLQARRNPNFIVVDFTHIKIITSIGLKVIFDTYRALGDSCLLMLCGLNPDIHRLVTLTGLGRLIPIQKDFDSAALFLSRRSTNVPTREQPNER